MIINSFITIVIIITNFTTFIIITSFITFITITIILPKIILILLIIITVDHYHFWDYYHKLFTAKRGKGENIIEIITLFKKCIEKKT